VREPDAVRAAAAVPKQEEARRAAPTAARKVKISARGIGKGYYIARVDEEVEAIVDFTLDVYEGEFLSIVGPSGCGKSTLLRLIAGLGQQTTGTLEMDGAPIRRPSAERGMAFQAYALFPWKTLKANVEFGPRMRGVPVAKREEVVRHFIELVGLKGSENKYPHELSGGQQQRGALARLFANDPEVLLLDEPLAAVDAQTREVLQEELLKLWSAYRKTVILVTHSIEEAVFVSDRIVVMTPRPGRIKAVVEDHLPAPRVFETRSHADYARLVYHVGALVRQATDLR
jgi:NitT/TauT family transport system ATP-binding protein